MTNPNDKASDMTKLEEFAKAAMQGLIIADNRERYCLKSIVESSVEHALALISELNKAESAQEPAQPAPKLEVGDTVKYDGKDKSVTSAAFGVDLIIESLYEWKLKSDGVAWNCGWTDEDGLKRSQAILETNLTLIAKGKP